MVDFHALIATGADGIWTDVVADVKVTGLEITYIADEKDFGSLNVYFDTETWDVSKNSIIYTDETFLQGITTALVAIGLDVSEMDYSEAGMQGDNYVNFDVNGDFIKSWEDLGHPLP